MTTDRVHEDRPVTGEQVVHPEALLIDPFFTPDALAALLAPNVAVRVGGPDDASEVTVAVITVDRPVRAPRSWRTSRTSDSSSPRASASTTSTSQAFATVA